MDDNGERAYMQDGGESATVEGETGRARGEVELFPAGDVSPRERADTRPSHPRQRNNLARSFSEDLASSITGEEWGQIMRHIAKKAASGDFRWIKFVAERLEGKAVGRSMTVKGDLVDALKEWRGDN